MLYSTELRVFENALRPEIVNSLKQIEEFKGEKIAVLSFDEDHIVVPVSLKVNIPSKGTVGGIDIRDVEPMLVKFSLAKYPDSIPELLSDRKDFPKSRLPHLYISKADSPARLCLVRNSPNEWYANHTIKDFLLVGEQWLFKAGSGLLATDGDEFDPLRIRFSGYHIYQYEMFKATVENQEQFIASLPVAVLFGGIYTDEGRPDKDSILKTACVVPFVAKDQFTGIVKGIQKSPESSSIPLFSLLVWSDQRMEDEYDTDLPTNVKQLSDYLGKRHVRVSQILDMFYNNGLDLCTHIPITYAIRRPKKIVGYNGVLEFITYVIDAREFKVGNYPSNANVSIRAHIEPFSTLQAARLSGEIRSAPTLFVGAGSLGSKMIMHDARAGKKDIDVVDKDEFLEHNLARHALFANRIGWTKSIAIVQEISSLYNSETKHFNALPGNFEDVPDSSLTKYQWLIDSTASTSVLNQLAIRKVPQQLSIARCELVDDGKLGLLYIEGTNRNPRVDDLVALAYYEATKNKHLQSWRLHDASKQPTQIDIGLGCSSTTTVMPDDVISYHAAAFSRILYLQKDRASLQNQGVVCLSILTDNGFDTGKQEHFLVQEFQTLDCLAGSCWQLRLRHGVKEQLILECQKKKNIETGGVLVGVANYKTKVIHVLDIIKEPQDSRGTCVGFSRGVKGLPDRIDDIKAMTGEVIGYIGEWHTHPMNLKSLSVQDHETILELKRMNQKIPIPTVAVIVTRDEVLPFVFD